MGAPPASGSLDQMRNVQRVASCGGECAKAVALTEEICGFTDAAGAGVTRALANIALNCAESPFANGCETGAVFFEDVAQQALFAQQPG